LALGPLLGPRCVRAHGQVPGGDSFLGQGRTSLFGGSSFVQVFEVEARSGPSGEDPSGYVTLDFTVFRSANFHIERPVSCLSVSGNQAVVVFELDPDLSTFPAVGAILEIEDNGRPGSDPRDTRYSGPVDDPGSCAARFGFADAEISEGDVTVTDAPPPPTSKSQCRNGGYAAFGFKNQRQSVALVERGIREQGPGST
jgi:hypothetical protein